MARQIACWFTGVKLPQGISHGQITTEIIATVFLALPHQPFGFFLALVAATTTGFLRLGHHHSPEMWLPSTIPHLPILDSLPRPFRLSKSVR